MRKTFIVCLLFVVASLVNAKRIRLSASYYHDSELQITERHDLVAIGPNIGATMEHYLVNSSMFGAQKERETNDRGFVLLMTDLSLASYDGNQEFKPADMKDKKYVDSPTKYYAYVFEDAQFPNLLYVGFPGTASIRDVWADIKAWIPSNLKDLTMTCPDYHQFNTEDVWDLWDQFRKTPAFDYYEGSARMMEQIMKDFPGREVKVTGHSLGGGMAAMVSKKFDVEGVTFSAPGTFRYQQRKGLPLTYNEKLRMFADAKDLVPLFDLQNGRGCFYDVSKECKLLDLACYISVPFEAHKLQNLVAVIESQPQLANCECDPNTLA
eukprot:ANDGO_05274.mRNA.1 Putative lipase ATG15